MKPLAKYLFITLVFVSYACVAETKSDILQLPWGIEYYRAKDIISKNGLTITREYFNQDDSIYSESLETYGPYSSFFVMGKYEQDDAIYFIEFHSNKFVGGTIRGRVPAAPKNKLRTLALKDKLTKEYGTPKEETHYTTHWEKDNLFVELFQLDFFYTLSYQNGNYYNKEILERYKTVEGTWITSRYSEEYMIIILSNGQMTTGTKDKDKLVETGPTPYVISGNRIIVVDKDGMAVVMEYILNRNTLKMMMDGNEMEFSRFVSPSSP
jgi:hypothetical protein